MPITRRTQGHNDYRLRNRTAGSDASSLVLVHVTSVGAAREILRSGQITCRRCCVFARDLTYFFILRPAYRLKNGDEKRELIDYFPFVFLFDTNTIGTPFHVYPFDTGGAVNGAFDGGDSPWIHLEDYSLDETLQAAADHIVWAFNSRSDYFDGRIRPGLEEQLNDWDVHALSFLKIARLAAEGHNQPDLRASSVEVAFDRHITLRPHLKFAIIPDRFLENGRGNTNKDIIDKLNEYGADWDTYPWRPNSSPSDFHKEINTKVRRWLAQRGSI